MFVFAIFVLHDSLFEYILFPTHMNMNLFFDQFIISKLISINILVICFKIKLRHYIIIRSGGVGYFFFFLLIS